MRGGPRGARGWNGGRRRRRPCLPHASGPADRASFGDICLLRPALPSHSKKYEREFQFHLIMSTFAADSHEKEKRGVPGGGPTPLGP